jgi:hypothetical protein
VADSESVQPEICITPPGKTKGEKYEGIAFTFCKAATIILLAQRFALPIASGAAAIFYILAYINGKKDTCCIMRLPLYIAAFWFIVCVLSSYFVFNPVNFSEVEKILLRK